MFARAGNVISSSVLNCKLISSFHLNHVGCRLCVLAKWMLEFVFVLAYRASAKLLLAASIESWPQVLQNDGRPAKLQMFQWNTITNESLCEWEMMASFWKHQRALFDVSNKQFELHRVQPQTNRSVFQFEEAWPFWDVRQIFDPYLWRCVLQVLWNMMCKSSSSNIITYGLKNPKHGQKRLSSLS